MHFWINKSQGCGFNGRYVPPSISAGTRRTQAPKPMVTPVHRFQSIESVASGGLHAHLHGQHGQHGQHGHHGHQGHHHAHHQHPPTGHHQSHRHPRAPACHTRFPVPQQHASNHQRSTRRVSIDYVSNGHRGTLTPVNAAGGQGGDSAQRVARVNSTTAKLKCGIWAIISLVPFIIVAAKYYLNGESVGAEVLVFLIMLVLILLAIGFVSLFEAFSQKRNSRSPSVIQISSEQNDTFEESHASGQAHQPTPPHVSTNMRAANMAALELPPPPYHIAVTLPPAHPQNDRLTIIQDSPPPTYEKAIT